MDDVYAAREELILSRRTHLDQLAHKLEEARVRRVIEPLLSDAEEPGCEVSDIGFQRDVDYVRDLGLIAPGRGIRMANPIYAEVVPRELTAAAQERLVNVQATWYVDGEGRLDMTKLLGAFRTFFGEHAEHWMGRFDYREAGPQLLLQSYLQRVVNGGGRIEREYGLGRGATDLLVLWPRESGQPSDLWERFVVECKVLRDTDRKSLAWTIERGGGADLGVHGAMRGGGRASGGVRPPDRETSAGVGGEAGGSGRRQDGARWRSGCCSNQVRSGRGGFRGAAQSAGGESSAAFEKPVAPRWRSRSPSPEGLRPACGGMPGESNTSISGTTGRPSSA